MTTLKTWRWAAWPAGALVLAVVIAWGIAPSRDEVAMAGLRNWGRVELRAAINRTFALRDSANSYRLAWELADTRERAAREAPAGVGLAVRADHNVPSEIAARFGDAARAELAALTAQPRHAVIVRVLMDSTLLVSFRRTVVIPATAAGPCVVSVRLPARHLDRAQIRRGTQLLGACGFYAAYGAPGEGMTKYLTRTSLATAGWHTAPALAPMLPDQALRNGQAIAYDPFYLACSIGRLEVCTSIFEGNEGFGLQWRGYDASRLAPPRRLTNAIRVAAYGNDLASERAGARLAALRATLGDDRFSMLWASKEEPAREFARREGRPIEALISEEMRSEKVTYRTGNRPRGLQLLIALTMVAVFATWAIGKSPRQYRP